MVKKLAKTVSHHTSGSLLEPSNNELCCSCSYSISLINFILVAFQYEGVIQKGNEMLVHHMEVFHCEVASSVTVTAFSGPGLSEGKPPELGACRNVIGAWAMGAKVRYWSSVHGARKRFIMKQGKMFVMFIIQVNIFKTSVFHHVDLTLCSKM